MSRVLVCLLCLLLAALPVAARQAAAPDEAQARVVEAGRALVAGDLATAERGFEAVRQLQPELAAAWLGLAEVRERQSRPAEALPLVRRAQELAPDDAVVHRAAGRLLARLDADDAALEALSRARGLEPERPEAYLLSALLLRRNGRLAEAATLLAEALERGADSADLRREQVLLLLADGRPSEAVAAAEAAVERYPGNAGLEVGLGLALAAVPERRAEAPRWLEAALASGVDRPQRVRFELGKVLLELGRNEEALAHLEAAAAEMPAEPAVWYLLARARQASGDREGGQAAATRFQELSKTADQADHAGKRLGAALNEAQALASADRLEEALDRVRALLAETPGLPRALALEAKVLYSLRRFEEALASIRAAAEAAPGAVEYRYLEGVFLGEMKRVAEAEAAFERALDLQPGLTDAWEALGRLALGDQRPGDAVDRFERAFELGADGPALRLFYSEALERVGRLEESRRQMEAYRRLVGRANGSGS